MGTLNQAIPTTNILVRGDSGFATSDIYDLYELCENQYVIRPKANRNLYRLAEVFVFYDKEVYYHSVAYQATSWAKPRRVSIRSTHEVGELLLNILLLSQIYRKTSRIKECLKPIMNAAP